MKKKTDSELQIKRRQERNRLIASGFTFIGCYLLVLVLVLLMFIINQPKEWTQFIVDNYTDVVSLIGSIFFLFAISYFYFYFEDREYLLKPVNTVMFFSIMIFAVIISYVLGRFVHIYARPYALFAILWLFLKNRRQALFLNFIFVFLIFSIDRFGNNFTDGSDLDIYASLLLGFVSGTLGIFLANRVKNRFGLLLVGVFLAVPAVLIVLCFQIPNADNNWIDYVSASGFRILGCILSSVVALASMPVFEVIFNRLTSFRLRELTSTNAALLVKLQKEAPGTFNHSLIVAQLAETCAVAIGENAELARAAGYYHDVGKLKQPDCFTENQSDYNLHDEITPELSADIIRSHARDGYELIKQYHLPKAIADVAREHHGTLPIKFFYDKAMRYSGDANVKDYSYFGPIPQTKIAAIIMIADATEAASRAAKNRTPEMVEKLCRSIIEERMDLNQFDECDITMKELTTIKQTLVEALSGIHHHRVKYPAIQFTRDRKAVKSEDEGKDE